MQKKVLRSAIGLLAIGAFMLSAAGCGDSPTPPEYVVGTLDVSIVSGPDTTSTVAHGAKVSFSWEAAGGTGTYTYQYQIDDGAAVTIPAGQTSIILSDVSVLTTATHTFKLIVSDGSNTASTTQKFIIGAVGAADTQPPTIEVTYPPDGFTAAPGSAVRFAWDVADESNATEAGVLAGVDSLAWAVDDTTGWVLTEKIPLAGSVSGITLGQHVLYVKAMDYSGNVTVVTDTLEIVNPTIWIIDEAVLTPGYADDTPAMTSGGKFQRDKFFETLFEGYSYEVWDASGYNYPTTADAPASATTLVWIGSGDYQNSSWGWNVGYEYTYGNSYLKGANKFDGSNILTDWLDAGNTMWIIGENWLEEIGITGAAVDSSLEYDYLGFSMDETVYGFWWEDAEVDAVVFDLASVGSAGGLTWPALASDIAKVDAGIGEFFTDWMVDGVQSPLRSDVTPIYRISQMSDGAAATPAAEDDWYAMWMVDDSGGPGPGPGPGGGNPQLVMTMFDIYYFSVDAAKQVTQNVLTGLFGQ